MPKARAAHVRKPTDVRSKTAIPVPIVDTEGTPPHLTAAQAAHSIVAR